MHVARLIGYLKGRVNSGSSLSAAMNEHPEVFEPAFVATIAAAEASGTLDQALVDLAEQMEQREALRMQVISSIVYPIFMICLAIAVVVFMLAYILPGLNQVFDQMHLVIPWPTRLLMNTGTFIRQYGLVLGFGCCVAMLAVALLWGTERGRRSLDHLLLSIPYIGGLLMKAQLVRLAMTLSSLLNAGLPLPKALAMAGNTLTNHRIKKAWQAVIDEVCEGQPLAAAVRRTGLFPVLFHHVLATADDTGGFEGCLAELAQMYRYDLQTASKLAVSMLEPLILLVMGTVVGLIVLAALLPIFSLNQTIG